ncbi:hypothetical protein T484DRAFT_1814102, partial [Baffinella frigidus]
MSDILKIGAEARSRIRQEAPFTTPAMRKHVLLSGALLLSLFATTLASPPLMPKGGKGFAARPSKGGDPKAKPDRGARAKGVMKHWSKDKIAAARPRDLQIDASGAGFFKESSTDATKGGMKGPTALRPYSAIHAPVPP